MLDRDAFHHAFTQAAQALGLPIAETPDGWTLRLPGGIAVIPIDAPYAAHRRGLAPETLVAALAEAAASFADPNWITALTLHLAPPHADFCQRLVAPGLALTLALDRHHAVELLTPAALAALGADPAACWARAEAQWARRLPAPERFGPLALWTGPTAADAAWHWATRQPDGWVAVPWVEAAGWAPPDALDALALALRLADAAGLGHHPLAPGRAPRAARHRGTRARPAAAAGIPRLRRRWP